MKITSAIWALLPAATQAAFKKMEAPDTDGNEYDNGEENVTGLKTALDKEKETVRIQGVKLAGFEAAKAQEIEKARKEALENARTSGDFKAIEEDYQRQIRELKEGQTKAENARKASVKAAAINAYVDNLAKRFVSPELAKAAIRARVTADIVVEGEGDSASEAAVVRFLTKEGKASALDAAAFEKEILTAPEFKGSIIASKGNGGGSTFTPPGGGSTGANDKPFDAANASGPDLVARLKEKHGDKIAGQVGEV